MNGLCRGAQPPWPSSSNSGKSRTHRKRHSRRAPGALERGAAELGAHRAERLARGLPRAGDDAARGRPPARDARRASSVPAPAPSPGKNFADAPSKPSAVRLQPREALRARALRDVLECVDLLARERGARPAPRAPMTRSPSRDRLAQERRAATRAAAALTSVSSRPKRRSGLSEPKRPIASANVRRGNGSGSSTPRHVFHRCAYRPSIDVEHVLLAHERHLEVDLRVLGLAVGAQVLVAQAARELEVAVEARDHQDLLVDLRRLRQRVALAAVDAARHDVVARALGRRLDQHRRLDLEEARGPRGSARVSSATWWRSTMHVLEPRAPQVEVAVLEPQVLAPRRCRRRPGTAASPTRFRILQLLDVHLDRAGRERRRSTASAGRSTTLPRTAITHSLPSCARALDAPRARPASGRHDDLRDAVAVAQVDEQHAAVVAHAVHPAHEHDVQVHVRARELAAGVRARPVAEAVEGHAVAAVRVTSLILRSSVVCRARRCAASVSRGDLLLRRPSPDP